MSPEKGRTLIQIVRMVTGADRSSSTIHSQSYPRTETKTITTFNLPDTDNPTYVCYTSEIPLTFIRMKVDKSLLVESKFLLMKFTISEVLMSVAKDNKELVLVNKIFSKKFP